MSFNSFGSFFRLFLPLALAAGFCACSRLDNYKEVNVKNPGTLYKSMKPKDWKGVGKLKVSGLVDAAEDIPFLKVVDQCGMQMLDLSGAEGLNNIGTFFASNKFSELTLPDSLRWVDETAFFDCPNLAYVRVNPKNRHFFNQDNSALFFADTSILVCYPPAYARRRSYTIPRKVKSIGPTGFAACSYLDSIFVEDGNASFCSIDGVLYTADSTKLIAYPAGRKDESFTLPQKVEDVHFSAFWGCRNLKRIEVAAGNQIYHSSDGVLMAELLTNKRASDDSAPAAYELAVYPSGRSDAAYSVPDNVVKINMRAFDSAPLKTVSIGANVSSIDKLAFQHSLICKFVVDSANSYFSTDGSAIMQDGSVFVVAPAATTTDYNVPSSVAFTDMSFQRSQFSSLIIRNVDVLGSFVFSYCDNLKSVVFAGGPADFNGPGTFVCCTNLEKLVLPPNVTSIPSRFCFGCLSLSDLTVNSPAPPVVSDNSFTGVDLERCVLRVPAASVDGYRRDAFWSGFKKIVAF